MRHTRALCALITTASLTVAACGDGQDAKPTTAAKTVDVSMTDNEFTPNTFEAESGQKVTFRFTNDGTVAHEAILGSESEQAQHEREMSGDDSEPAMDDMDHGGGKAEAITVQPGDTGTLTQTFDEAGTVVLGCHEPGHYEAGMKATITIT